MITERINKSFGKWRATELVKTGRKSHAVNCYGATKQEAVTNVLNQIARERQFYPKPTTIERAMS